MERKQAETLGDVLKQYLHALGADKKILEMRALNSWEKIVGQAVAKITSDLRIQDGVLTVKFRSPLVRSEIKMHKTVIIKRINEAVGEDYVKDLKIR